MGIRLNDLTDRQEKDPTEPSKVFRDLLTEYTVHNLSMTGATLLRVLEEAGVQGLPDVKSWAMTFGMTQLVTIHTPEVEAAMERLGSYVRQLEDEVRRLQATIADSLTK